VARRANPRSTGKIAPRDDKEAVMGQFVKVGTRAEFEGLEVGKLVQAGGQGIAILNIGGSYYAIENTCPHRGGPLLEGTIAGDEVTCPWHGSRFNIKTGAVITPPARQGVKSFPVRTAGEDVEVEIE
jgi:nitrite reductase/ring-hydroxylating ferredoxin subunit